MCLICIYVYRPQIYNMSILFVIITILLLLGVVYVLYMYLTSNKHNNQSLHSISLKILASNYPKYTIIDLLKWAALNNASLEALKYKNKYSKDWKTVNYSEYWDNVMRFSNSLVNLLGNEKPIVAIIGTNEPEWFYSNLGAMASGGISVGMYSSADSLTCQYILKNSMANVLVIEDSEQLEKFSNIDISGIKVIIYYGNITYKSQIPFNDKVKIVKYLEFTRSHDRLSTHNQLPKPEDIATIIYTSGTTGAPKGAITRHNNIMDILNNMILTIHTKSSVDLCIGESIISYLPLNHVAAQLLDIYLPIAILGTVYFAQKDALRESLGDILKEVRPTIFIGVPRVWEKIMEKLHENLAVGVSMASMVSGIVLKSIGLDRCKYAITATAPISTDTRKYFEKFGLELCDVYGMSETAGPISLSIPGKVKKGTVGIPLIDTKIGDDGEILVRGKSVFSGYYNNEEDTLKSFTSDGWFKTGDLGKIDNEGYLYVTGRSKDIIITSGGENISPISIETKLQQELSLYFSYIMVVGDKRKFLSMILVPNKKTLSKFGNDMKENKELISIIENARNMVNNNASSSVSKVQKWTIINSKFKIGNELTPTLKLRRMYIQEKYTDIIDKLYA
jgi:long-chain-fatty-acid--CoA ligase ACSBG